MKIVFLIGMLLATGVFAQNNPQNALDAPYPNDGSGSSGVRGGGDECIREILAIKKNMTRWIQSNGHRRLDFVSEKPVQLASISQDSYKTNMLSYLLNDDVKIYCDDNKIFVNHIPVTCENYKKVDNNQVSKIFIHCDYNRLLNQTLTPKKAQYQVLHHEYASLAGYELLKAGNDSYQSLWWLSDQVSNDQLFNDLSSQDLKRNFCEEKKQDYADEYFSSANSLDKTIKEENLADIFIKAFNKRYLEIVSVYENDHFLDGIKAYNDEVNSVYPQALQNNRNYISEILYKWRIFF